MKIAIIGAGIGGLTLALALRQRGIHADVFEQAPALTEVGAAVALSANATRELDRLGLIPGLEAVSTEPSELIFRDGRTGERIAAHSVRNANSYRARFGGPYFGVHRADLQKVLSGAVASEDLHLGYRLEAMEEDGAALRLVFAHDIGWPLRQARAAGDAGQPICGVRGVQLATGCPRWRCMLLAGVGLLRGSGFAAEELRCPTAPALLPVRPSVRPPSPAGRGRNRLNSVQVTR
jgi:glycine/D-amino acid oxidase-like deaminating enzyme